MGLIGLALIAAILAFGIRQAYRTVRPPAPKIDYGSLDLASLREMREQLDTCLDRADELLSLIRSVRASDGDPDRLRQVLGLELDSDGGDVPDRYSWLFDGDNDMDDCIAFLRRKLMRVLPSLLEITENFVLWHGKNKYKTTLEPAGKGVSRLVVTRRKFSRYSGKCAWCGDEMEQERADEKHCGTPVYGITYGDQSYVFDTVICRLRWMQSASGGRDFSGEITAWDEWDEGGDFDGKELPVVRESYRYFR